MTISLEPAAQSRATAIREFREVALAFRRLAIRGARAILGIERTGAHLEDACASVGEFAERNGMSAAQARELTNLGHAIEGDPGLADDVECGRVPVASAAILGEIAMASEAMRGGTDWRALAGSTSTRDFRCRWTRRRDEFRAGEPVYAMTAFVTPAVREDVERARDLVSHRLHTLATVGQALGVVVDEWLDDNDPCRAEPGRRRVGDTSLVPHSRYVPAEVDRAVRARSEDRCIVPFCGHALWLERSHRVAHARGGSREADNLDLLCDVHHLSYEAGVLRIVGPPDDPAFTDRWGRPIGERNVFGGSPRGDGSGPAPPLDEPQSGGSRGDPQVSPVSEGSAREERGP